ncbi:MAG TPA: hypothetical protein PLV92_26390, partial [Pirellulaceae bacterium]|nr:hypothetical protein [Pirellulaceae bacterium]
PWVLSHSLWTKQNGLTAPNPPELVACLTKIERFAKQNEEDLSADDLGKYADALRQVFLAFKSFAAVDAEKREIDEIAAVVERYADLASARLNNILLVRELRNDN